MLEDADFILSKVNEMGGTSQHGHGAGQERKVVILVNKCDVAGDFYGDENGVGGGSGNDLGKNMAEIGDNKNVNQDNNIVSLIENKYNNCKVIPISAKTGKGLSTLTKTLGEIGSEITGAPTKPLGTYSGIFATNQHRCRPPRRRNSLRQCRRSFNGVCRRHNRRRCNMRTCRSGDGLRKNSCSRQTEADLRCTSLQTSCPFLSIPLR